MLTNKFICFGYSILYLFRILNYGCDLFGNLSGVTWLYWPTISTIVSSFGYTAYLSRNYRNASSHSFDVGNAQGFRMRWNAKYMSGVH